MVLPFRWKQDKKIETPLENGTSNQVFGSSVAKLKQAILKSSPLQVKVFLCKVCYRERKKPFF